MPFVELDQLAPIEPVAGFRAVFVHSENMTLAFWEVEQGAELPEHAHPHEQISTVLEGRFELTVDGETRLLDQGTVAVIPPNVPHSGRAHTRCRILDAFHPVREDFR